MERWGAFLNDFSQTEIVLELLPGDSIIAGDRAIHGPARIQATRPDGNSPVTVTVL